MPILTTALASAVALIPFVVSGGSTGFEIVRPMAVVILGGLVTSTLLNLFVDPGALPAFGFVAEPDDVGRGLCWSASPTSDRRSRGGDPMKRRLDEIALIPVTVADHDGLRGLGLEEDVTRTSPTRSSRSRARTCSGSSWRSPPWKRLGIETDRGREERVPVGRSRTPPSISTRTEASGCTRAPSR